MKRNLFTLFGATLSIGIGASAQNVFVADYSANSVVQIAPGGVQNTFASGLSNPYGLAFNNAGDLFVSDDGSGNIYEYAPDATQSTFASELSSWVGV